VAHSFTVKVGAVGFCKMLVTICLPDCMPSHRRTSVRTSDAACFESFKQHSGNESLC
jgi:hypothetical protein